MLFKRSKEKFKEKEIVEKQDESKENNVDLTLEDSRKRKFKLLRKINRKRRIANGVIFFVIGIGLIGGYSFLLSSKKVEKDDQVSDANFIQEYVEAYFTYPRTEEQTKLLETFTLQTNSQLSYTQDLETVTVSNIKIYNVETVTNTNGSEFYRYYGKGDMKSQIKKLDPTWLKINFSIDVIKDLDQYLVIRPIEMQLKNISAIDDTSITDKYTIETGSTNENVKDDEYIEVEQAIVLFLKTYNSDYEQTKLLTEGSNVIDELDEGSELSLDSITKMTKDEETYYVNVRIRNDYIGFGSLTREYYLELSVNNHKIKRMEVY